MARTPSWYSGLAGSLNYDDHPDASLVSAWHSDLNTAGICAIKPAHPQRRVAMAERTAQGTDARRCLCGPAEIKSSSHAYSRRWVQVAVIEVAAQLVETGHRHCMDRCADRMTSTAESRTPTMQWAQASPLTSPASLLLLRPLVEALAHGCMSTRGMVPQSVLTFHPNFLGNAGGLKKAKLQSLRLAPEAKRFVESDRRERGMDVGFMAARAREKWLPTPRFPARSSAWCLRGHD